MDNFVCCSCKRTFPNLKGLHGHIVRGEKISLDDYYKIYFPRKDRLTGDLIDFKDHEQYFSTFFSSKENMGAWFQANIHTSEAAALAKEIISIRVELKGLKYAPSQVELRTVPSPSITSCQKMFNYNEFCKTLGLKTKFKYGIIDDVKPLSKVKILIDTREQMPFDFSDSEVKKLDVGDYTVAEPDYADVYVERKSINDFFGTFYSPNNIERFEKEIARAKSYGFYVIVVVEDTITNCLRYKSFFFKDKNFISHTFHNVRNLMQKFDNLQFVFAHSRHTAKNLTNRIFNQGKLAKELDWQYLVDTKQI